MAFKLGLDCKAYRNTSSWESPTWVEVENIKDLTLPLTKGEWEASLRSGNGVEEFIGTLKSFGVDFNLKWDPQNDPDCEALLDVYLDVEDYVDVLILDGPITTSGSQGPRYLADVFGFQRNENLTEGVMTDVNLKPSAKRGATHVPYWHEVGVSSSG
jgi:hypothetical protein